MSYNSKRTVTSIITGIVLAAVYIIYALGKSAPATDDLKAWAAVMLVFVGIGVGFMIVIQILFHIGFAIGIAVKEELKSGSPGQKIEGKDSGKLAERIMKSEMVEDEMAKIISLKTSRIQSIFTGIGLIGMLIALTFGTATLIALHILLGSIAIGGIVEGIVSIFLHERGVRNG